VIDSVALALAVILTMVAVGTLFVPTRETREILWTAVLLTAFWILYLT